MKSIYLIPVYLFYNSICFCQANEDSLRQSLEKIDQEITRVSMMKDSIKYFLIKSNLPSKKPQFRFVREILVIIEFVLNKDKSSILKLCNSSNSNCNAYGAIGLFFLKSEGFILSDDETDLLNEILHSNKNIDWLDSCEILQMKTSEVLTEKFLLDIYTEVKSYKLL